jgi:hypothetical protein
MDEWCKKVTEFFWPPKGPPPGYVAAPSFGPSTYTAPPYTAPPTPKPTHAQDKFAMADQDKDGHISKHEFSQIYLAKANRLPTDAEWRKFSGLDLNNDGMLSRSEFARRKK